MALKGNSGIGKNKVAKAAVQTKTQGQTQTSKEPDVRGVPQSKIDALRGERDHLKLINWVTVQDDYYRVGISITKAEAMEIVQAVNNFTFLHDTTMRKAWTLRAAGREHDLTSAQREALRKYDLCAEYCKVAPLIPVSKYSTIYRGIKMSTKTPEYPAKLLSLKVGDTWDVDGMPTSFSTKLSVAESFSWHQSKPGIIMHMPTKNIKNTPSIMGLSHFQGEYEAFVTDYNWKVAGISDQRQQGDGYYHIYLDKP